MQTIPLNSTQPNQDWTTTLDNIRYEISLRTIGWRTYASITANGVDVIDGVQCQPNQKLLPYNYLEGQGGNFSFYTQNDEYPIYTQFGTTQFLLYASAAELAAYRGT